MTNDEIFRRKPVVPANEQTAVEAHFQMRAEDAAFELAEMEALRNQGADYQGTDEWRAAMRRLGRL